MKNQTGQVIIILLLIILVALTIGVAIVQNSLSDVSTSTKTEQSSRAFSAAEAGIEQALITNTSGPVSLDNSSTADINVLLDLPANASTALEYPPITKADFAQFWLADPTTQATFFNGSSFQVYFGNCSQNPCEAVSDKPAIEVDTVIKDSLTGNYRWDKQYFDSDGSRTNTNNFQKINGAGCDNNMGGGSTINANTTNSPTSQFYCYVNVLYSSVSTDIPILVRVRILYSSTAQKIALMPIPGNNGKGLPAQATTYTSVGKSGESIRQVKIFKEQNVVPYFFDFAIFSTAPITKQ
ncbi:hypothetical protein HY025_05655 [Candidatus Daviesbacteria bacterium]|nr:hypothetical protein [Candidatus Daviesbacteria bacterium]